MKAYCIDNMGQYGSLTLMKGYDVLYIDHIHGTILIKDDTGATDDYSRGRFVLKLNADN